MENIIINANTIPICPGRKSGKHQWKRCYGLSQSGCYQYQHYWCRLCGMLKETYKEPGCKREKLCKPDGIQIPKMLEPKKKCQRGGANVK